MLIFVREWTPTSSTTGTQSTVVGMVENYESLIWTERFQDVGDFELIVPLTSENIELLKPMRWLEIEKSVRIMRVYKQTMYIQDGVKKLKVEGKSLEDHMSKTTIGHSRSGLANFWDFGYSSERDFNQPSAWFLAESLITQSYTGFTRIDYTYRAHQLDIVRDRFGDGGPMWPDDTIPYSQNGVKYSIGVAKLLPVIIDICIPNGLGFRWGIHRERNEIRYDIYSGRNLFNPALPKDRLIFDVDGGNWIPEEDVYDFTDVYTIGISQNDPIKSRDSNGNEQVHEWASGNTYPDKTGPNAPVGFNTWSDFRPMTDEKFFGTGEEDRCLTLAEIIYNSSRPMRMSTGKVPPTHQYKYDSDYFLGDLVGAETLSGSIEGFRVTEQIFISDKEGVREYPTLTLDSSLVPGVWRSEQYDINWNAMPTNQYWGNQP